MSIFEQLNVKHKSRVQDVTTSEIKTKLVYVGSREICEQAMKEDFKCGQAHPEFGNLESITLTQEEGPVWNLEVNYSISLHSGAHSTGTAGRPTDSTLDIKMLSIPIESHADYLRNWNNNLYTTNVKAVSGTVPSSEYAHTWNKATVDDDEIPTSQKYQAGYTAAQLSGHTILAWGKYEGELTSLPQGAKWYLLKKMRKPGVESFNYPVYELTETTKSRSQKEAAWTVAGRVGKVIKPINGDFGIVSKFGGNWLCEGADVKYNGKYWVGSLTYTHSPDVRKNDATPMIKGSSSSGYGWDKDIYIYQKRGINPYDIFNDPDFHTPQGDRV